MSVMMAYMTLRQLLETKANIHSVSEFREKVKGFSRQQAWALWNGKDTLGLRVGKRIAEATGLSLDELAEVDEAVPASKRRKSDSDACDETNEPRGRLQQRRDPEAPS